MQNTILCLIATEANGALDRASLESLSAARELKQHSGGTLNIGVIGQTPSIGLSNAEADRCLIVEAEPFQAPRYATDVVAAQALVKESGANWVLAPANSRIQRFLSGLAVRVDAAIDTHVTQIEWKEDKLIASRWFYRQRIESSFSRPTDQLWILSLESGCAKALESGSPTPFEAVEVAEVSSRTTVHGVETTSGGDQTIRPDSDLLFVAGAGWTKKQSDQNVKVDKAAALILDFINRRKASLGSSKSMVDLSSEGQTVLPFLTHLHQVGQTGSTPRHQKGLATCCHGEEPHAVGWRFVKERRAINTDANCGWAHGKADVLYVADAFEVMEKVNSML